MGRIQDAMRRAGLETADPETSPAGVERGTEAFPVEGDTAADLARPEEPQSAAEFPPEAVATAEPVTPPVADDVVVKPSEDRTLIDQISAQVLQKIVLSPDVLPASREQYRRLAAALHGAQESNGLKVVMVTSAVVGEGKTLTASNLALTLSESYKRRVLLVDADLRRPSIEGLFSLAATTGLAEALMATERRQLPVHQLTDRLSVLPAGRATSDPMSGLTSDHMRVLIDEARDLFDWVVIDTPPVVLLPDAHLLASMVDGAVLVIRAGATPYDLVTRATEAVGKDRLLGVVLNGTSVEHQPSYHGYYGRYGYYGTPEGQRQSA